MIRRADTTSGAVALWVQFDREHKPQFAALDRDFVLAAAHPHPPSDLADLLRGMGGERQSPALLVIHRSHPVRELGREPNSEPSDTRGQFRTRSITAPSFRQVRSISGMIGRMPTSSRRRCRSLE